MAPGGGGKRARKPSSVAAVSSLPSSQPAWVVIDNSTRLKARFSSPLPASSASPSPVAGLAATPDAPSAASLHALSGPNAVLRSAKAKRRGGVGSRLACAAADAAIARGAAQHAPWVSPLAGGVLADVPLQAEVWASFLAATGGGGGGGGVDDGATLLVTSPPGAPAEASLGLVDMALRCFRFAAVCVVTPHLLHLVHYACRGADRFRTVRAEGGEAALPEPPLTAVVVDAGESGTSVCCFCAGRAVSSGRSAAGGAAVTTQLLAALVRRHPHSEVPRRVAAAAKERCCYVAADGAAAEARRTAREDGGTRRLAVYGLPEHDAASEGGFVVPAEQEDDALRKRTGQFLPLHGELYAAPEVLFAPSLAALPAPGVAEAVARAVARCPPAQQAALWGCVVVAGGVAATRGYAARLLAELRRLAPAGVAVALRVLVDGEGGGGASAAASAAEGGAALLRGELPRGLSLPGLPAPVTRWEWEALLSSRGGGVAEKAMARVEEMRAAEGTAGEEEEEGTRGGAVAAAAKRADGSSSSSSPSSSGDSDDADTTTFTSTSSS
eukprot:Rhum_TRINITY_DN13193_c0_g1::Rhum_TRINITY_DN13193_c0_g1_i1::g.57670::m.57670/K11662/ACTR6, ARP6; actin-related protein 6